MANIDALKGKSSISAKSSLSGKSTAASSAGIENYLRIITEHEATQAQQNAVKTASRYQAMTLHERKLREQEKKDADAKLYGPPTPFTVKELQNRVRKYEEKGSGNYDQMRADKKYVDNYISNLEKIVAPSDNDKALLGQLKNISSVFNSELSFTDEEKNTAQTELIDLETKLNKAQELENKVRTLAPTNAQKLSADSPEVKAFNSCVKEFQDYMKSTGFSNLDELKNAVASKKVTIHEKKRISKLTELSNIALSSNDFEAKSAVDPNSSDVMYNYINDIDGFRRAYKDVTYSTATATNPLVSQNLNANITSAQLDAFKAKNMGNPALSDRNFEYLTEEEIKIFNFYYSTEGSKKANEYLDSLQQDLNIRSGTEIYEGLNSNFSKELFGVTAGLDQFGEGVKNLFNTKDDYIATSDYQVASSLVREDLAKQGWGWKLGYDFINTTANMAPSILASTIVGYINPIAGAATGAALMGSSAAGNAYQEMLNMGYDKSQARAYSSMVGISEAALSAILSGIGKLGGFATKTVVENTAKSVNKAAAKWAIEYGGKVLSEGLEEGLQEILDPFFRSWATDTTLEYWGGVNWGNVLYSALLGGLSAGLFEVAPGTVKTVAANVNAKNLYGGSQNELVAQARELLDGTTAKKLGDKYQKKLDKGKNLSGSQLRQLVEANEEAFTQEDKVRIQAAAELRLGQLGEKGNKTALAGAIAKTVVGESLTVSEKNLIKNSQYGNRVINEAMPDNVASGNYASDWARKIGTERLNVDVYNLDTADSSLQNGESGDIINSRGDNNGSSNSEVLAGGRVLSTAGQIGNGVRQRGGNPTANSRMLGDVVGVQRTDGRNVSAGESGWMAVQKHEPDTHKSPRLREGLYRRLSRINLKKTDSAGRVLSDDLIAELNDTIFKDENGKIISLFHWTPNIFDVFKFGDIGFHLGTLRAALDIREGSEQFLEDNSFIGNCKEIYCNMKNPVFMKDYTGIWQVSYADQLVKQGVITQAEYDSLKSLNGFFNSQYSDEASVKFRELLESKHYDGIIYINEHEDPGSISVIAFHPEQIITVAENGVLKENSGVTEATSDTEVASFAPENEQSEDFESGEENNTPETENSDPEETGEDFKENRPVFTEPNPREIAREASREEKIASLLGETMSIRQRQVNAVAEKFGLNVRWSDKIPQGTFNPKSNTVYMNPETTITEGYMIIFKHEFIHYLENRKAYTEFKSYLFEESKVFEEYIKSCLQQHGEDFNGSREEIIERYTEIVFERRKNAKEIPAHIRESYTTEKIEREIVADFCSEVLIGADDIEASERALNEIAQTNRNFIQRIIDFISDWIDKIRGEGQNRELNEDLEYLNARLARVYDSKAQKNTAKYGDVKYSLNKNAPTELHKALYDINYFNEVLLRDETPAILVSQKGVNNLPMVMNASHIRENVFTEEEARNLGLKVSDRTHYHGIGEEYFLQIIDSLDNVKEAYRGTKNANMPSRREKYFLLVTEFKDNEGNTINVPVYIEEGAICNNVYLTSNKFATVFGRDDFRKYINEQVRKQNLVRIKNKNNTHSEGGVPLPPSYESVVFNDSITENKPTVNSNYMQETENNSDESFSISKFDFAGEMQNLNDKLNSGEITAEKFISEVNKLSKKESAVNQKLRAAIDETRKAKNKATQKLSRIEKTVIRQREQLAKRRQEVFEDVYALREERATRQKNIEYIRREVRRMDTAYRTNSDTKNVPEHLKDAIGGFIKIFAENDRSPFDKKNLALIHLAYSSLGGDIGVGGETVMSTFDPQVERDLNILSSTLDGKTLRDLSYGELIMIRNIVDNFKHMLSNEKAIIIEGKKYEIDELGRAVIEDLSAHEAARDFAVNRVYYEMLTPAYFFKHIGGPLAEVASDIFNGQGVWYRNMELAKTYIAQIKEECGYDENWGTDTITLETERGETLNLTIEQALLLYATARREYSNKAQNSEHLYKGGVVLDTEKNFKDKLVSFLKEFSTQESKKKFLDSFCKEIDSRAHQITPLDAGRVREMLTENQIKYADKMVEYLSNDMAVLGNEVSMKLFGIKKYTENYYIPYNSARNFLSSQPGVTSDVSLKHSSFTHNTQYKANNPLVLSSFSEVCAGHIEKMCMYNAMAIPIDNLTKILNWKTISKEGTAPKSIRAELERAYGKDAVKYLERFIQDINGNMRSSGTEDFGSKLQGKAKMSQVAANLSVVVQQYSSIVRATSIIPAKYFASTLPSVAEKNYEQLKKYSSVAGIKEMGRFDTGVGVSNSHWLLKSSPVGIVDSVKTFAKDSSYRKDVFGWAAGKMDELAWGHIWAAVKAEIKDTTNLKPGTKEFFEAAGKKFDEVINLTQVYDSTLSRSQIMRDKGFWAKSVTAFMSEPTVTFNMVCDAIIELKNGGKAGAKKAGKILSAVVISIALNNALKSIVTAMRDDDEDESYLEKYISAFVNNMISDINPLNYIPVVRDFLSIIEGYTPKRAELTFIGDIITTGKKLIDSSKNTEKEYLDFLSSIAVAFDIPLKNIVRDFKAVGRTLENALSEKNETTVTGIKYAIKDGKISEIYADMGDALEKGDEEEYERIYDYLLEIGKEESDIRSGLKSAFKDSKSVTKETEKYIEALEDNKTYQSLDEEGQNKLSKDITDALAKEKMISLTTPKGIDYDSLYETRRKSTALYKRERQKFLDKGLTPGEIDDGLFVAKIKYMQSLGIDTHEYLLYKMATSATYADTDNSGGVSNAEKRAAIKEMDIDNKSKNILYENMD